MAFNERNSFLVVAGDGHGTDVTVSVWRLDKSNLTMLSTFGAPRAARGRKLVPPPGLSPWTISFSPLGEYLALCAPPHDRLVVLHLPDAKPVDVATSFAGRSAPPASALTASLAASLPHAGSVAWWSANALALADARGSVGIAKLPGCINVLGHSLQTFTAGTIVACKTSGELQGVFVLQPLLDEEQRGALAQQLLGEADGSSGSGTAGLLTSSTSKRFGSSSMGGSAAGGDALVALPGWQLLLLAQRTPEQMVQVYIREQAWGDAHQIARSYGLDTDMVYRARWAARPVDAANIQDTLAKMADRRWVVEQCCTRVASDYEGQRKMLNYGLRESARHCKPQGLVESSEEGSVASGGGTGQAMDTLTDSELRWWKEQRLRLWRYSDRLEIIYAVQGRSFDAEAYAAFRDLPVLDAAASWAQLGYVSALNVLAQHYPAQLCGRALLSLLDQLPETLNPRLFSGLLPKANGELPTAPRPVRKLDWIECMDTIRDFLSAGRTDMLAETDEVYRLATPPAHMAPPPPAEVAEWYARRALAIDRLSGQLYTAVCLLEIAVQQRGVREGRVAELMRLSRALSGGLSACHQGPSGGPGWRVTLEEFAGLSGRQQLRLLLQGSSAERLEVDMEERVLPFTQGLAASEVSELLDGLLVDELEVRPAWCEALVKLEAHRLRVYSSPAALVQAITKAIIQCPHTEEWDVLLSMIDSVQGMLDKRVAAAAGQQQQQGATDTRQAGASDEAYELQALGAGLSDLRAFVVAGSLMAKHGLPLTVRHISQCGREEAARCVRQLLGRVQRSTGPQWSDSQWSGLWRDLREVQAGAFPYLEPQDLMAELVRCLCHTGRFGLAGAYLRGTGSVQFAPEAADALVASVATEILASASSVDDPALVQAIECLQLAPSSPDAQALLALATAISLLPGLGVSLLPAQVMQMGDRLEVIRMALEASAAASGSSARTGGSALSTRSGGTPATAVAGSEGSGGSSGARAVGAALKAAKLRAKGLIGSAFDTAGGVAAAAGLTDSLKAVAEAVAGAVATATGGGSGPLYRQLGRLLELGELLGLKSAEDVPRIKNLAGRYALKGGDVATAQALALALVAVAHAPVWDLAADLGCDRRVGDDVARKRLLGFALLHCPVPRMTRLLDELQVVERRLAAPELASQWDATPDHLLASALTTTTNTSSSSPQMEPATAMLPSLGDVPLALHALLQQPSAAAGSRLLDHLTPAGTRYAQLQRTLLVGCYSHCLRALLPAVGANASVPAKAFSSAGAGGEVGGAAVDVRGGAVKLMQAPLKDLLDKARAMARQPQAAPQPSKATPQRSGQQQQGKQKATAASTSAAQTGTSSSSSSGPHMSREQLAALEAAEACQQRLAAARDSRAMRHWLPGVDASQFCSGDATYRRQVILEQAALAGKQAALGSAEEATQLLVEAQGLAQVYGVARWDVMMAYVSDLLAAAPSITLEVKSVVLEHEAELLQRPRDLLAHLAANTFGALPPASAPHLALLLSLVVDALNAMAAVERLPALTALGPQLDKLKDLLDKAAGALKNLAVTAVLAPLLAAALAPLGVSLAVQVQVQGGTAGAGSEGGAAAGSTSDRDVLISQATRALYVWVKPSNVGQGAKLLKALNAIFTPSAKAAKAFSAASGTTAPHDSVAAMAAVLGALHSSVPYLCLFVKGMSTAPNKEAPASPQAAFAHLSEHFERLSPGQLSSWLAYLLLGKPCPLPQRTTGTIMPVQLASALQMSVLEAALPRLAGGGGGGEDSGGAGAGVRDDGDVAALQALYRRLCALQAVKQHSSLTPEQVEHLEEQLMASTSDEAGAAAGANAITSSTRGISGILSQLALSGCGLAVLLEIANATAAVEAQPAAATADGATVGSSSSSAGGGAEAAAASVSVAMSAGLQQALASVSRGLAGEDAIGADGLSKLRGLVAGLDTPTAASAADMPTDGGNSSEGGSKPKAPKAKDEQQHASASAPTSVPAAAPEHLVRSLRDSVWRELQSFTEGLSAGQYGHFVVDDLLDLQASLGNQVWAGWQGGGADRQAQQQRLLYARTCALVSKAWSSQEGSSSASSQSPSSSSRMQLEPSLDELASPAGARAYFGRLMESSSSEAQLVAAQQLLQGVWKDGAAWADSASASGGADGDGDGGVGAGVSGLHACWLALCRRHLDLGVQSALLRLLEGTALQAASPTTATTTTTTTTTTSAIIMTQEEFQVLMDIATASATTTTGASTTDATAEPSTSLLALCIGLLSPHEAQREAALAALPQALQAAGTAAIGGTSMSTSNSAGKQEPEVLVALALLALLLADDRGCSALAELSTAAPHMLDVLATPLMSVAVPAHPRLTASTTSTSASSSSASSGVGAAGAGAAVLATHSCLFPALVAGLAVQQRHGLAAALVARRMRVHPAVSGLANTIQLLERFLLACSAPGVNASSQQVGHGISSSMAAPLPHTLAHLTAALPERCHTAHAALVADLKPAVA